MAAGGVRGFLAGHPDVFARLPAGTRQACLTICTAGSHLRPREARGFWLQILQRVEGLKDNPRQGVILQGAVVASSRHWALALPYFKAVHALPPRDEAIEEWVSSILHLVKWDVDVAVTFVECTPQAAQTLGPGALLVWGERAARAVQAERRASAAARAYLEESSSAPGTTPLDRWGVWLDQAVRVARVSGVAAEQFIRRGTRVCGLLSAEEAARWVSEGLAEASTEDELIGYFSGTHLKALEARDGLVSGVTLEERANSLSLLVEAFLGRPVAIRSNAVLAGVRGFAGGAATDGRTIYLPGVLPRADCFKLAALHQASLLGWRQWCEHAGARAGHLAEIHRKADELLLQKLPGLLSDMKRWGAGRVPPSYPAELPLEFHDRLPWWGDLLPQLLRDTQDTIERLVEKAGNQSELPSETVEALIAQMMSRGRRDEEGLWGALRGVLDNAQFESPDPEELEEGFRTFFYKEWDADLRDYKVDWCLIRQRPAQEGPSNFAEEVRDRLHGLITLIRGQFVRLKPENFKKLRAQESGDELDLETLVPALVDRRAEGILSDRIYTRRDKRTRDVAVLFLVDMSASTEERVGGKRVIDIQKEAMVLMAEALDSLGDPFAIYGFSSEGRFRVDLFRVKEFDEEYGDTVRNRLGNLDPREFTRLGAVLRHGIHKLDEIAAAIKLMVVLTDGRPYDLEYGHINYAVTDTKKALTEARQHGVHPFIITSDKRGAGYMRRICPQTQSIIVPRVESLPTLLPAMYRRLTT
jgi:hypothetical protein